jgi:sporulation protein YlmC with PRC-barrel domain
MKRTLLVGSAAVGLCLGLAVTPLLAASPIASPANQPPAPIKSDVSAIKPAEKCLSDLRAFDGQMEKGGYWLSGSGYGYGYPMSGYGSTMGAYPAATAYQDARPGYEVRTLVAAADILARHGQQQACEDALATTRQVYQLYADNLHSRGVPAADVPGWRNRQIAAAEPVTKRNTSFRSDELLGTDVRNARNEALGSVDDLVMSPRTGKIAYLVIARGGIFGIGEKHVPVPWEDFKVAPDVNLLVLDTSKRAMNAAPQVKNDRFAAPDHFDRQSQSVDAYWKAHLSDKDNGKPNG